MKNQNLSVDVLMAKYVGKSFRYASKYGGYVENLICESISVTHHIDVDEHNQVTVTGQDVNIVSDKGNVYELNNVEFYE